MAKGCAFIFAGIFLGFAAFCGLGLYAIKEGARRAAEIEANMTPEEKATREKEREQARALKKEQLEEAVCIKATETSIAAMLKSPASAKFNLQAATYGRVVLVRGTVDSQNSFGAMVRNDVRARYLDGNLALIALDKEEIKGLHYDETQQILDQWKLDHPALTR